MLKIKLRRETEDSVNKIWYKIKLNGNIVDYGILHDIEETLGYVGLNFIPNKRNIISLSCSDEGTLIVKELRFLDSRAIAGERTSFNYYKLISGGVENINEVLNEDFSNVQQSSQVGFNKEWFFSLEEDQTISLYNPEVGDARWQNFPSEPEIPIYRTLECSNGDILDGEFLRGEFIKGTRTKKDGTKEIGNFEGSGVELELVKGMIIDTENKTLIINRRRINEFKKRD